MCCSLQTKLLLLSLDAIALLFRSISVLGLLLHSFLLEASVDLVLHSVAASGRFVHEALCVAFFEGGNDIGTRWETWSVFVQVGTSAGRITHGILGVKMRMHICGNLNLSASRYVCCAVGRSGVVRVRSRWNV